MRKFSTKINMIHGSIWDKMIIFAFPLALTGMLQQLFNGADVGILGKFVGGEAMSAVGTNVPIIGLIISIAIGLSIGANVVIARFLGMRDEAGANRAVSTAFVTAVGLGVGLAVIGEVFAGPLLDFIGVPESVRSYAESYLRVYLLGLPFIVTFNFLAAILRSHGDTQTPLLALLFASIFNILGNLWFVLLMDMDTGGVAFATVLSNVISSGFLLRKLFHTKGALHLSLQNLFVIDKHSLTSIIRIGWPAALQGSVFSLSNLIVQSAINSLGPDAIAGSAGAFIIEINIYCFINAFGLAATTFVSQNWGAGRLDRCRRATWISFGLNLVATSIMVGLVLCFGRTFMSVFNDNEQIIALGMIRILIVVVPQPICVLMETLSGAMRGYGYSLPPALVTLICVCSVRFLWVWTAFAIDPTFVCLMWVYPLSWIATAIGLSYLYWRYQQKLEKRLALRIRAV